VDFDTQRLPGVPARLQTSTKSQVTASHDPAWLKYVVLARDPRWGEQIDGDDISFTSYSFHCPSEHLDAIYGNDRFPMGS